jgi:hypothetical protein
VSKRPRIRSDVLRRLIDCALKQGWQHKIGGAHPMIVCPICGHREIYTMTGKQHEHEIKKKIARLRKHGVLFNGRGGIHE